MQRGEKMEMENTSLVQSGIFYLKLREIIALHMRGSLGLSQIVTWLGQNRERVVELNVEPRIKSLLGYVLSVSLSFSCPSDIEVHRDVLDVCCRKEFIPGVIGKYISLVLDGSQYKKEIFLLVKKVLDTLTSIDEVPELEERLFLCLSQIVSDSNTPECDSTGECDSTPKCSIPDLLKYLILRASPQMTGEFMRLYLKSKGEIDEQMSTALQVYMDSIRDIDILEILRSHRTEINTAARYSIRTVQWLIEKAAGVIVQVRDPGKINLRNTVIEWLREVRDIWSTHSNTTHNEHVLSTLRAESRVDTAQGICLLVQSPGHLLIENAPKISLPILLDLLRVCSDITLIPGTGMSELLMLRVLEVTCDKSILESPGIRDVLDIPKEFAMKYDHYIGLAFRKGTSTVLSINILGALAEYVCPVRLNDIPLRIAQVIKDLELRERRANSFLTRSLTVRQDTAIRVPCTVLRKVLQKGKICKKVLRSVFDTVVFLLSQNESVMDLAASVLQVVLIRYREEDKKEPKENREKDNTYVLCNRIYEEIDMDLFAYSHRAAILELLVIMIQCTDTFLTVRLNDTALGHVLTYYIRHKPLVKNRETAALLSFLRHVSVLGICKEQAHNTLVVASGMYDMGMTEAVSTITMLQRQHPRLLPDILDRATASIVTFGNDTTSNSNTTGRDVTTRINAPSSVTFGNDTTGRGNTGNITVNMRHIGYSRNVLACFGRIVDELGWESVKGPF